MPRTRFRNRCRTEAASTRPCAPAGQPERIRGTRDPSPPYGKYRQNHVYAHDPLKRRAGGFQHMLHVGKGRSDLLGNRAVIALTGPWIDRTHPRQEYVVADADTGNMG